MKIFAILFASLSVIAAVFFLQPEKSEWIMPKELNEISGISFVDDHTLACVQDELGIIFLYDLDKSEVVKRIEFAGKGDYEGITIRGNDAYVITGDGMLYEILNYMNSPRTSSWQLNLSLNEESEALCYDAVSDRLLIAFKESVKDEVNPGIFSFDLRTKKLDDAPAVQINFRTAAIGKKEREHIKKLWEPADIAIDTHNIYMIDAINGHMLKFSLQGDLESLIPVERKKIRHPEGIAIQPNGDIYICNDANNEGKGKIMKWKN